MLKIKQFIFNPFGESTYIIYDEPGMEAIVVDPGMSTPQEEKRFDDFVSEKALKIEGIVNTHLHLDHCFGANYVKDKYGVQVKAHVSDAPLGQGIAAQAARFGMKSSHSDVSIDVKLAEGDTITLGTETLEVIHTPGHTPGGICLYSKSGNFLISGDTLFRGSVGRTDLPGGNHPTLIDGIRKKLFALPDHTLVLPGHGPATTIGDEKTSNPFLS